MSFKNKFEWCCGVFTVHQQCQRPFFVWYFLRVSSQIWPKIIVFPKFVANYFKQTGVLGVSKNRNHTVDYNNLRSRKYKELLCKTVKLLGLKKTLTFNRMFTHHLLAKPFLFLVEQKRSDHVCMPVITSIASSIIPSSIFTLDWKCMLGTCQFRNS